MDDLGGGDDVLRGIPGIVHVLDDPLGHGLRGSVQGLDGGQGAVRVVGVAVEGGDVDSGDLHDLQKEFVPREAPALGGAVALQHLHVHVLALAHHAEIQKIRHGLGVVDPGAAGENHVPEAVAPVPAPEGDMSQLQDV